MKRRRRLPITPASEELKTAALGDLRAATRYRELAARATEPETRARYTAAVPECLKSAQENFRASMRARREALRHGSD